MRLNSIFLPIFLYSMTAAMFLPVFQSLLYAKVCASQLRLDDANGNGTVGNCSDAAAARDPRIHTQTNIIMLIASVCMCLSGIVSSYVIGRVGDRKSRKRALLIPFVGLLLADITLMLQTFFIDSSPYLFILSELLFGCFGGYMAVISSSFAFLTTSKMEAVERAKNIARMEGLMGLGGMLGFLICSQLSIRDYFSACCFFFIVHSLCLLCVSTLSEPERTAHGTDKLEAMRSLLRSDSSSGLLNRNLLILLTAFGVSFFAFVGSAHIMFFYLKQRFGWDAQQYGYLRAAAQAASTFMALVTYPWLKSLGSSDSCLAIVGLLCRAAGKAWIAIAWTPIAVFGVVTFDMFSRFPATALRSLIASNVEDEHRGGAFAVVGAVEGVCNLLAAVVFHSLFPWSLSFLPQLSFLVMAALILPPTTAVWIYRKQLEVRTANPPSSEEAEATE